MKRYITAFLLCSFYIPLALADGVSRVLPSAATADDTEVFSSRASLSNSTTSRSAVRSIASRTQSSTSDNEKQTGSDGRTISRVASTDTGTQTSSARTKSNVRVAGKQTDTGGRDNLSATVSTVGRSARLSNVGTNSNPAVRRAGVTLRPSTAEVGGRAKIAGTDVQTGSNIAGETRGVQNRAATTQPTAESIAAAKERLEQKADLNKSCQEQYNECMDQFCAVIDTNQKRCSCSSDLSRYAKVESAVKEANTQLNDVAQRIRYVGLSADEITAIMTETEAEEALSSTKDTSETRNMLDDIADMIKDPTSSSSYTSSSNTSFGLDLDLDFSSDTADLFSLDFLNGGTDSFAKLRGKDLYNAATKRCKTVLTQCKEAGATSDQITGNYDLAIDKDCISYEQGLTKMNETLVSNVRSATRMLQKARLSVLENKNQYDAKGCISALETCMMDDMVCGDDYAKCLDPTKKYIDENGNVVLGQNITYITDFMQNYDNSQIDSTKLSSAYAMTVSDTACRPGATASETGGDGACVMKYLLQKIGTGSKIGDATYGLCRPVLDKCQYYTYDTRGNYKPYNDIVVNYVQRALVNIRAAQRKIISDYASSCMVDVATCYNNQVTQVNTWSSSASVSNIKSVMSGACRNVALTCAYAVFTDTDKDIAVDADKHCNTTDKCLTSISEMFYQSLLCPDNSTWDASYTASDNVKNRVSSGWVNKQCKCNDGYYAFGGACLADCEVGQYVNSYGSCSDCSSGYTATKNGDEWPASCTESSSGGTPHTLSLE